MVAVVYPAILIAVFVLTLVAIFVGGKHMVKGDEQQHH